MVAADTDGTPTDLVQARLDHAGGWRSETLRRLRDLILQADPEVVEDVKWRKPSNPAGALTFSHDGLICTGETYKDYVKLTFAQGAALDDPGGLFNAGFGGGTRRAIDVREGQALDAEAFKTLFRAAVAHAQTKTAR